MYSFRNDYSEGAHPVVLQALTETNLLQTSGYGTDDYCADRGSIPVYHGCKRLFAGRGGCGRYQLCGECQQCICARAGEMGICG